MRASEVLRDATRPVFVGQLAGIHYASNGFLLLASRAPLDVKAEFDPGVEWLVPAARWCLRDDVTEQVKGVDLAACVRRCIPACNKCGGTGIVSRTCKRCDTAEHTCECKCAITPAYAQVFGRSFNARVLLRLAIWAGVGDVALLKVAKNGASPLRLSTAERGGVLMQCSLDPAVAYPIVDLAFKEPAA